MGWVWVKVVRVRGRGHPGLGPVGWVRGLVVRLLLGMVLGTECVDAWHSLFYVLYIHLNAAGADVDVDVVVAAASDQGGGTRRAAASEKSMVTAWALSLAAGEVEGVRVHVDAMLQGARWQGRRRGAGGAAWQGRGQDGLGWVGGGGRGEE